MFMLAAGVYPPPGAGSQTPREHILYRGGIS